MKLEKEIKLKHYKGDRYTVIGQGTHSETLEDMIIYQNNADKKVWIRPLNMFYEEVEYNGKLVPRFEVEEEAPYRGVYTKINDLPVGTKFYVHNGVWNGEIVFTEGDKKLMFRGSSMDKAEKIDDSMYLYITINES